MTDPIKDIAGETLGTYCSVTEDITGESYYIRTENLLKHIKKNDQWDIYIGKGLEKYRIERNERDKMHPSEKNESIFFHVKHRSDDKGMVNISFIPENLNTHYSLSITCPIGLNLFHSMSSKVRTNLPNITKLEKP